jgi:exodeoxyribonuclease VII large subunit
VTLADLAADLHCKTPSEAAERVIPEWTALNAETVDLLDRLVHGWHREWQQLAQQLDSLESRPLWRGPDALLAPIRRSLASLTERFVLRMAEVTRRESRRLDEFQERIVRGVMAKATRSRERLQPAGAKLGRLASGQLSALRSTTEGLAGRLSSLDPRAVLGRGYLMAFAPDGTIVAGTAQADAASVVTLEWADGQRRARIEPGDPST